MRLPRLKRVPPRERPHFRLTNWDIQIIQAVYRYRALTTVQIEALFFAPPGQNTAASSTRCRHRLQMLYHHGLLERIEQLTYTYEGRKPLVYVLTEQAAQLLAERTHVNRSAIDWHPRHNTISHQFLTHLLETNDVRIAIERAVQSHEWTVERWLDDRTLKSRHAKDTRCQCQLKMGSPDIFVVELACSQYALSQQIKVGSAVHRALDEFQSIDLPLYLTIAPWQF